MHVSPVSSVRYGLLNRLHRGHGVEFFRARSEGAHGFEKVVLLKRTSLTPTDDSVRRRLAREGVICSKLSSHNVVGVYDFYSQGDSLCLTMELVDGVGLDAILACRSENRNPIPVYVIISLASQLLDALDYLHKARDPVSGRKLELIHRCLSPDHIMLDRLGVVKLVGFGQAQFQGEPHVRVDGLTRYSPPEARTRTKLTTAADLYAVACVLYELLTLQPLQPGFDSDPLTPQELEKRLKRLPADAAPLLPVLRRALLPTPDERFRSAGEMVALLRAQKKAPVTDAPPTQILKTLVEEALFHSPPELEELELSEPGTETLAQASAGMLVDATGWNPWANNASQPFQVEMEFSPEELDPEEEALFASDPVTADAGAKPSRQLKAINLAGPEFTGEVSSELLRGIGAFTSAFPEPTATPVGPNPRTRSKRETREPAKSSEPVQKSAPAPVQAPLKQDVSAPAPTPGPSGPAADASLRSRLTRIAPLSDFLEATEDDVPTSPEAIAALQASLPTPRESDLPQPPANGLGAPSQSPRSVAMPSTHQEALMGRRLAAFTPPGNGASPANGPNGLNGGLEPPSGRLLAEAEAELPEAVNPTVTLIKQKALGPDESVDPTIMVETTAAHATLQSQSPLLQARPDLSRAEATRAQLEPAAPARGAAPMTTPASRPASGPIAPPARPSMHEWDVERARRFGGGWDAMPLTETHVPPTGWSDAEPRALPVADAGAHVPAQASTSAHEVAARAASRVAFAVDEPTTDPRAGEQLKKLNLHKELEPSHGAQLRRSEFSFLAPAPPDAAYQTTQPGGGLIDPSIFDSLKSRPEIQVHPPTSQPPVAAPPMVESLFGNPQPVSAGARPSSPGVPNGRLNGLTNGSSPGGHSNGSPNGLPNRLANGLANGHSNGRDLARTPHPAGVDPGAGRPVNGLGGSGNAVGAASGGGALPNALRVGSDHDKPENSPTVILEGDNIFQRALAAASTPEEVEAVMRAMRNRSASKEALHPRTPGSSGSTDVSASHAPAPPHAPAPTHAPAPPHAPAVSHASVPGHATASSAPVPSRPGEPRVVQDEVITRILPASELTATSSTDALHESTFELSIDDLDLEESSQEVALPSLTIAPEPPLQPVAAGPRDVRAAWDSPQAREAEWSALGRIRPDSGARNGVHPPPPRQFPMPTEVPEVPASLPQRELQLGGVAPASRTLEEPVTLSMFGPGGYTILTVPPSGLWFGRSPRCDVVLADAQVAPLHAQFVQTNSGWMLQCSPGEEVEVNGSLLRSLPLTAGLWIRLGSYYLLVQDSKAQEVPSFDYPSLLQELVDRFPHIAQQDVLRAEAGLRLHDSSRTLPAEQLWAQLMDLYRENPDSRPFRRLLEVLSRVDTGARQIGRALETLRRLERMG